MWSHHHPFCQISFSGFQNKNAFTIIISLINVKPPNLTFAEFNADEFDAALIIRKKVFTKTKTPCKYLKKLYYIFICRMSIMSAILQLIRLHRNRVRTPILNFSIVYPKTVLLVKQLLVAVFLAYKPLICQSCTVNYGPSFSHDLLSERKVRGL